MARDTTTRPLAASTTRPKPDLRDLGKPSSLRGRAQVMRTKQRTSSEAHGWPTSSRRMNCALRGRTGTGGSGSSRSL